MYRYLINTLIGLLFVIVGCSLSPTKTQMKDVSTRKGTTDYTQWHLPIGAKMRLGKGGVSQIKYSPDGSLLAVAGSVGVWIYDAQTRAERTLLVGQTNWIQCIAFSPTGETLAAGCWWDGTVHLWEISSGTRFDMTDTHASAVYDLAFSPDGKILAINVGDRILLEDMASGIQPQTFTETTYRFEGLAFSPDGKILASASDNAVHLWETASGKLLHKRIKYKNDAQHIAFSPHGETLVVSFGDSDSNSNKSIQLWRVATGRHLRTFIEQKAPGLFSIALSPDGKTLAGGVRNSGILLWEVATGKKIRTIKAHTNILRDVVFSPDGKTLAAVGDTVLLWDVKQLGLKELDTLSSNTHKKLEKLPILPEHKKLEKLPILPR